ncbi:RagB/SusD domain protein [gut metagenome]|uniref:RagB/SusD domain protein n=1 Tax=gut metagenome TaxID=749906 RepID=J9H1N1_9ZZZZ
MKFISKISNIALLSLAMTCSMTSCDYLDVVPPEQPDLQDANKDRAGTLGFLYSCYAGVVNPMDYYGLEMGADEYVLPRLWQGGGQKIQWNLNNAANLADGWRWGSYYRFVGQCHLFMKELPNARAIDEEEKVAMKAEIDFLLAYYHMQVLFQYGPCPINDHYIAQDTPASEFPGRSHYDYVTDWCYNKFEEAYQNLPETRSGDDWGRATRPMARALQARLRLYAASKLWNGGFPYRDWKNKNFETPGYGLELVSMNYDQSKWTKALEACKAALEEAEKAGHKLFTLEQSEELRKQQKVKLPFVPNKPETGSSAADNQKFLQRVMLMRYVVTTRVNQGNEEIIWGLANQGNYLDGSLPHRTIRNNQGTWKGGWSGMAPTLNALALFYQESNGHPIKDWEDAKYYKSAGIADRKDIIEFNTGREPRFYAWVAFDGGDFGNELANGQPLRLEMRNSNLHGYNPSLFNRDNCETGYLNQKFFPANFRHTPGGVQNESKPRPVIRMAELYLNLAECYAALGNKPEALKNLNIIRKRAGVKELTEADLSTQSLEEWVHNERHNELWLEGHRYFDIRRWMIAPKTMSHGVRKGLNALEKLDPTFEEFNKPVVISQQFEWHNRMYVSPVFENEIYKGPQFVQFPGY